MHGPSDPPRPAVRVPPSAGRRSSGRLAALATAIAAASVGLPTSPLAAQAPRPDRAPRQQMTAGQQEATAGRSGDGAHTPAWARMVTGAATLSALLVFDPALRRAPPAAGSGDGSPPPTPGALGAVADFGNALGDWDASLPWIAGASLAVGGLTEGLDGTGRAGALLAGVAAGSFATVAVKKAVGRARPNEDDALSLAPFSGRISFPSGHAAFAFSVAGGVDAVTDGWIPAAAAYAVASTSAFARVYSDKHWFSDVVVGSAIGALASRAAAKRVLGMLGLERSGRPEGRRDGPARGADPSRPRPRGPRVELVAVPTFLGVGVRF